MAFANVRRPTSTQLKPTILLAFRVGYTDITIYRYCGVYTVSTVIPCGDQTSACLETAEKALAYVTVCADRGY